MKPTSRNLLLFLAYAPLHWCFMQFASVIWHPPAGWRFAVLLLMPPRWWLPLAVVLELFYRAIGGGDDWRGWQVPLVYFLGTAAGPWLLRRQIGFAGEGALGFGRLLAAMLVSAAGGAVAFTAWPAEWGQGIPKGELFLQLMLGNYIGMLMLVPLILMLTRFRPERAHWQSWRIDLPLVLLPSLLLCAWGLHGLRSYQAYFFAAGLLLVPSVYLAFRSGWRGVAIGLSTASLLVVVAGRLNDSFDSTLGSQLFLAITGSALLMLGASIETLRARQQELAMRNRELQQLAEQLRSTAERNMTQSESLRRWITSELHDELGQNLTALQMQLKLAENRSDQPQVFAPMREIIGYMRKAISGLLNNLRPAGLDEFGLRRTLEEGSISQLVKAAGLDYSLRIRGDAEALEKLTDDQQTTLYRIVQEAATNTLRHAQASRFDIRLRVRMLSGATRVILCCADDGLGIDDTKRKYGRIGLHGIPDRALSFGGRSRIRSNAYGTRVLVVVAFA